mgnify:CR=1 FL=1
MKNTPYNLYIHFDVLNSLFVEKNSRLENLLKCALTSIELSTKLLNKSIAPRKISNFKKITQFLKDIEVQLTLLSNYAGPIEEEYIIRGEIKSVHSDNIENLKSLSPSYTKHIDKVTALYFDVTQKVTVKLGLENQMNEIRKHFCLPEISSNLLDTLDYVAFVRPNELLKLSKTEYFNSEDELFMVVHQVSECWFNIGLKELEEVLIEFKKEEPNVTKCEEHFNAIYDILEYVSYHVLLLEHMILADYHPLRVALRGASGGQSHQGHMLVYLAKNVFTAFLGHISKKEIGIADILQKPNEHVDLLSTIKHFENLERSLKNFFFQHFALSSSIIGSKSFGSIGHEVVSLADRFVEPLFKEIDQVKYELALKTNFQYGKDSGVLLLEKEGVTPVSELELSNDPKILNEAVDNYFDAISKLDSDSWINLFSEDGYIEDPIGSRPYIGHKELGIFFKGILRMFAELRMRIIERNFTDKGVEVEWEAKAVSFNGKDLIFQGKEVFQVSTNGKITVAQVYWNPKIVSDQL